jgi:hypothetical protein
VTVLAGTVHVGFGPKLDVTKGRAFPAGSFYVNPPGLAHALWSEEEVTLQITAQGPWAVDFVDAAAKP